MAVVRFAAQRPDPRLAVQAATMALRDVDVRDPAAVTAAVVAAMDASGQRLGDLDPSVAASLWSVGRDPASTIPPALAALTRRLALVAAGRALTVLDVESFQAAADWRARWMAAVEAEIADAPPEVAEPLSDLGAAVSRTLTERGIRAPDIVDLDGSEYDNILVASYRLFGTLGRAEEIERMNGSSGPLLPGRFAALTA